MKVLRFLVLLVGMLMPVAVRAGADFEAALQFGTEEISAGRFEAGIVAARRAYGLADGGAAQVRAARLVAAGYFAAGQLGLAAWWLRRALEDAPDGGVRHALGREIAGVRAQNPLQVKLRFSVAPSSNINNGFDGARVLIWGLPFVLSPNAQALSGLEYSGGIDLRYRLAKSAVASTEVAALAFARGYVMSRKARRMVPEIRGGDFAFGGVGLALVHRRRFEGMSEPTEVRLGAGRHGMAARRMTGLCGVRFRRGFGWGRARL